MFNFNDSKVSANGKSSVVIFRNIPHLCFFAQENMEEGEELRYDYQDNPKALWWRKLVRIQSTILPFILNYSVDTVYRIS